MPIAIFPNQRSITVHKDPPIPGKFTTISIPATMEAMRNLSYSAYMLYSYCSLNADNYEFGLSKAYLCENTAFTKNTYYSAFHELEEKGYFVPRPGFSSKYDFYESPKSGQARNKKRDTVHQKQVQNINNNNEENKEQLALPLNAPGGAQTITSPFFEF